MEAIKQTLQQENLFKLLHVLSTLIQNLFGVSLNRNSLPIVHQESSSSYKLEYNLKNLVKMFLQPFQSLKKLMIFKISFSNTGLISTYNILEGNLTKMFIPFLFFQVRNQLLGIQIIINV